MDLNTEQGLCQGQRPAGQDSVYWDLCRFLRLFYVYYSRF